MCRDGDGFQGGCRKRKMCGQRKEQCSNKTAEFDANLVDALLSNETRLLAVIICIGQNSFASLPDTNHF